VYLIDLGIQHGHGSAEVERAGVAPRQSLDCAFAASHSTCRFSARPRTRRDKEGQQLDEGKEGLDIMGTYPS
jgi:hypothetical protein